MVDTTEVETIEVAEFVDEPKPHPQSRPSIPVRVSKFTARNPARCLLGSLAVATLMSYIALGFGKFTIEVDNKGWRSRGTTIANREMQNDLVIRLRDDLFNDVNGSVWEDAENNIVRGFILLEDRSDDDGTCDASSFYATMLGEDNLYAAYQAQNSKSILDPDVLFQICEAETTTHDRLVENKVCGCEGDDDCPTPASLIRLLRLTYNKFGLSCSELKEFYTPAIQGEFTDSLVTCTNEVLDTFDTTSKTYVAPSCPPGFSVSMVDTNFAIDGNEFLTYTTSYFFTAKTSKEALFKVRTDLGYGETDDNLVSVAYDTLWERQTDQYVDSVLFSDMVSQSQSRYVRLLNSMNCFNDCFSLTLVWILGSRNGCNTCYSYCNGNSYQVSMAYVLWSFANYLLRATRILCLLLHCWIEIVSQFPFIPSFKKLIPCHVYIVQYLTLLVLMIAPIKVSRSSILSESSSQQLLAQTISL